MVFFNLSLTLPNEPGVYALLPPGWYYFVNVLHYDNHPDPVEEMVLAIRRSEINVEFQKYMCRCWSETSEEWNGMAVYYCNWHDVDGLLLDPSIEQTAANTLLIDQYIREVFGAEVFSQRFYKPWGGYDTIDIDEEDKYYSANGQTNPNVYKRFVKLPPGFDVNRISKFCVIFDRNY
ncbi:ORF63 [Betabaculovirus altermyunipunctae]|uniref:ORF63 n=1 Tax=Betabaculovirus altermyunipunctae TaxID=3051996 RepID=A0A1S5YDY3_9BBAC|nr:ORF63 [Betabaculovirus altermyunipunctae]AQQ80330.1 ORF63 [Betabaculovirus altermyunipunctae]